MVCLPCLPNFPFLFFLSWFSLVLHLGIVGTLPSLVMKYDLPCTHETEEKYVFASNCFHLLDIPSLILWCTSTCCVFFKLRKFDNMLYQSLQNLRLARNTHKLVRVDIQYLLSGCSWGRSESYQRKSPEPAVCGDSYCAGYHRLCTGDS
jgi:hypothetical protein